MDSSQEPAAKRQKLASHGSSSPHTPQPMNGNESHFLTPMMVDMPLSNGTPAAQLEREKQAGILHFVSPDTRGFTGILKQRFSDFLVNEIDTAGNVLHLTSDTIPGLEGDNEMDDSAEETAVAKDEPTIITETLPEVVESKDFSMTAEDRSLLESFFGTETVSEIEDLYRKITKSPHGKFVPVTSKPITEKSKRIEMHQAMRRIFNSRLETTADGTGVVTISTIRAARTGKKSKSKGPANARAPKPQQLRGKLGWDELGGQFLHFNLYKENRDTMELLSFISGKAYSSTKSFHFAGTKDKRGVTVQRCSAYRVRAEQLAYVNKVLNGNNRLGNFKYEKYDLQLGDLSGNEFLITLRDCQFVGDEGLTTLEEKLEYAKMCVAESVTKLRKYGFLNYYGLQRFGTHATGTDETGKKILNKDYEGAVRIILSYSPKAAEATVDDATSENYISKDEIYRAQAIHTFLQTGNKQAALALLPNRFSAEKSIISYLGTGKGRDYLGALLSVPRGLRLMYVHAYQSLVWNMAASERWKRFGSKVIEGDLVLDKKDTNATPEEEVDEDGEVVIHAAVGDAAVSAEDQFERARPLSAEEAQSGKYTIFDIVLPTPGFDIVYPANEVGEFYKEFMGSERGGNLDPYDMRRSQKDFSLSGSYRPVMGRMGGDVSFEVRAYKGFEQLVKTDLEKLNEANPASSHTHANVEAICPPEGSASDSTALATTTSHTSPENSSTEKIHTEDPEEETKIAIVVKFQLGQGQYATMALRELMKLGITDFKPKFGRPE